MTLNSTPLKFSGNYLIYRRIHKNYRDTICVYKFLIINKIIRNLTKYCKLGNKSNLKSIAFLLVTVFFTFAMQNKTTFSLLIAQFF